MERNACPEGCEEKEGPIKKKKYGERKTETDY